MKRLSLAGFQKDFVQRAILPDWWDAGCENDASLLPDLEIRVARFMATSVSGIRDPLVSLLPPSYAGAQLRRLKNVNPDQLLPAIHTAIQVASALVRTLGPSAPSVRLPPPDGLTWRTEIKPGGQAVTLDDMLSDLWGRGIPVTALDVLPSPGFQGLACLIGDRPVIVLGYKHDEPGRLAALVAHEAGHIASGHCSPENPVVDQDEDASDSDVIEQVAELYAKHVLVGGDEIPNVAADNFRDLAKKAAQLESTHGADAGAIIFAWARSTGNYTTACLAAKALYRASGGRRLIAEHFTRHVELDSASESDRALIHCAMGGAESDATPR